MAMIPDPPPGVLLVQYADDISVYSSGVSIERLSAAIKNYIPSLLAFLEERELIVSPEKSTVTLFTPDTHEFNIHPKIYVNQTLVKLDKEPKLLGVNFDTMHTFSKHVKKTISSAKTKVNMMKALAGSAWGQDKDILILTYKSVVRSKLEYGAPILTPTISKSRWEDLQIVQNQALRVATGSLLMSAQDHLHQETKVLPIKPHSTLLTKQFLAACHLADHPRGKHLGRPPEIRGHLKPTLLDHETEVRECFPDLPANESSYKHAIKSLHTSAVQATLQSYNPNRVLQLPPPEISSAEEKLPRKACCELSRLRSGFSRNLMSYMSTIDNTIENNCPLCEVFPHDTNHLHWKPNPTDSCKSLDKANRGCKIFI